MRTLSLQFQSIPKPIQSVRFRCVRTKTKSFVHTYQPKAHTEWKNWIKLQAKQQLPDNFSIYTQCVVINLCHFIFQCPKSFPKYKIRAIEGGKIIFKQTRPDLGDNLLKGFLDALSGLVYKDDSQIVEMNNIKKYYGNRYQILLKITEIKNEVKK